MSITVYYILLYKRLNMVVGSQGLADGKTTEPEKNQNSSSSINDE